MLFQFPTPFPTFTAPSSSHATSSPSAIDIDAPDLAEGPSTTAAATGGKRVSFANDPELHEAGGNTPSTSTDRDKRDEDDAKDSKLGVKLDPLAQEKRKKVDGRIGELEIRRSGRATMRLGASQQLVFDVRCSSGLLHAWERTVLIGNGVVFVGCGGDAAIVPAACGAARSDWEAGGGAGRGREEVRGEP
jgi:hypothetical protein